MRYSFRYENPFNVEAEWIVHLRALDGQKFDSRDHRDAFSSPPNLEVEVEQLIDTLPHLHNPDSLIKEGFPTEEKLAVQEWKFYKNFPFMLQFLSRYTEILACEKILSSRCFEYLTHTESGELQEFESLNTNVEETGLLILPKVKTINDPLDPAGEDEPIDLLETDSGQLKTQKHWATDRFPGIQSELSGTFYVDTNLLTYRGESFRVLNSVLKREVFPEGKKVLRIAVCPIAHKDFLKIDYNKGVDSETQNLFSVKGLKQEEFVHNRIRAALLKASSERADLVIFPEALGDEITHSKEFFYELQNEVFSHGYSMPSLILMPTWWHQNQNELLVLSGSGMRLCVQQKQEPYLMGKEKVPYLEDLRDPERVIHIVHIPDVGRFTFPICRDFLDEDYKADYIQLMLRQLYSTFLLCPSYSPGKTQFNYTAPEVIKYGCFTVWCNTCAAYHERHQPPEQIGFIAGPLEISETMEILSPKCGGSCGDENTPCLFLTEITMDHSACISCSNHIFKKEA